MDRAARDALYKIGQLLIETGWRLKRLSQREPTMKNLDDIYETLEYCGDALNQVAEAILQERSRKKHDL